VTNGGTEVSDLDRNGTVLVERSEFTPTQKRMLAVLHDGEWHDSDELKKCVNDELTTKDNVRKHVDLLNKRLRRHGREVVCSFRFRRTCFRQMRLLHSAKDGKR